MLNRDVFHTDPDAYRIANQGVAKVSFPPSPEARATLRAELETFVCDGHYGDGLARILDAFLRTAGRGAAPAAWISGFSRPSSASTRRISARTIARSSSTVAASTASAVAVRAEVRHVTAKASARTARPLRRHRPLTRGPNIVGPGSRGRR
jgi:hypothetical protein